mgnify:FL=1
MKKLTESDEFKDGLDLEGFVVKHPTFGIGTIVDSVDGGDSMRIHIKFEKGKARWLIALYANLSIISNSSEQEESISVSDKSEEYQANNKELEDHINELERNARLEEEKQRLAKRKRNDIWILIVIGGFFPVMFMLGVYGPCLDC